MKERNITDYIERQKKIYREFENKLNDYKVILEKQENIEFLNNLFTREFISIGSNPIDKIS